MNKEITFNANCEICGRKNVPCRKHHLVPQRLLKILPFKRKERWERMTVIACNSCNCHLHPENKLYNRIKVLEGMIQIGKGENQEMGGV